VLCFCGSIDCVFLFLGEINLAHTDVLQHTHTGFTMRGKQSVCACAILFSVAVSLCCWSHLSLHSKRTAWTSSLNDMLPVMATVHRWINDDADIAV